MKQPNSQTQHNTHVSLSLLFQAMYDKARVPEDCVEILTAVKMIIKNFAGRISQAENNCNTCVLCKGSPSPIQKVLSEFVGFIVGGWCIVARVKAVFRAHMVESFYVVRGEHYAYTALFSESSGIYEESWQKFYKLLYDQARFCFHSVLCMQLNLRYPQYLTSHLFLNTN